MKQGMAGNGAEWRDRAVAAAESARFALDLKLSHLALAGAREAARAALLALGSRVPRCTRSELARLQEIAAATPDHLAGRPAEREAMLRAGLSAVSRLVP